jgi:hypothetical protein
LRIKLPWLCTLTILWPPASKRTYSHVPLEPKKVRSVADNVRFLRLLRCHVCNRQSLCVMRVGCGCSIMLHSYCVLSFSFSLAFRALYVSWGFHSFVAFMVYTNRSSFHITGPCLNFFTFFGVCYHATVSRPCTFAPYGDSHGLDGALIAAKVHHRGVPARP